MPPNRLGATLSACAEPARRPLPFHGAPEQPGAREAAGRAVRWRRPRQPHCSRPSCPVRSRAASAYAARAECRGRRCAHRRRAAAHRPPPARRRCDRGRCCSAPRPPSPPRFSTPGPSVSSASTRSPGRSSASPRTSNPGPRFATVAGANTRRRDGMAVSTAGEPIARRRNWQGARELAGGWQSEPPNDERYTGRAMRRRPLTILVAAVAILNTLAGSSLRAAQRPAVGTTPPQSGAAASTTAAVTGQTLTPDRAPAPFFRLRLRDSSTTGSSSARPPRTAPASSRFSWRAVGCSSPRCSGRPVRCWPSGRS